MWNKKETTIKSGKHHSILIVSWLHWLYQGNWWVHSREKLNNYRYVVVTTWANEFVHQSTSYRLVSYDPLQQKDHQSFSTRQEFYLAASAQKYNPIITMVTIQVTIWSCLFSPTISKLFSFYFVYWSTIIRTIVVEIFSIRSTSCS